MSNKHFWGVALAGVLAVAAQPAKATPSGLINTPSTDIYAKGTTHLDVDFLRFANPLSDNSLSVGVTQGLGPDTDEAFGRSEIGIDAGVVRLGGVDFGDSVVLNAKTQLYNDSEQNIRVVAGAYNIGNRTTPRIGYITASKNFGDPGRVHLGVSRTFNKSAFGRNYTQFQVAYEKLLSEKLLFLAEYNSGSGPLGTTGVSLNYNLTDRSGLQVAYFRPNSSVVRATASRNVIYVGYDVNFGRSGEVEAPPADPAADGEAQK
jgi:hypothetical protein